MSEQQTPVADGATLCLNTDCGHRADQHKRIGGARSVCLWADGMDECDCLGFVRSHSNAVENGDRDEARRGELAGLLGKHRFISWFVGHNVSNPAMCSCRHVINDGPFFDEDQDRLDHDAHVADMAIAAGWTER